ncbi:hypothetical protein DFH09DRAFT_1108317 [Mycena vulgaris]|nr:hypothetical protein DFH09DRAFT_1108317 [Mycena vulgaris]
MQASRSRSRQLFRVRRIRAVHSESTRVQHSARPALASSSARTPFATSPLAHRTTRIPATPRLTERTAALVASPLLHSTLRIPATPSDLHTIKLRHTTRTRRTPSPGARRAARTPTAPSPANTGLSSPRRCSHPDRARVPPPDASLREHENSPTRPRTLHIAVPAPPPRGHSMRSRDSSRPNTVRKAEDGLWCVMPISRASQASRRRHAPPLARATDDPRAARNRRTRNARTAVLHPNSTSLSAECGGCCGHSPCAARPQRRGFCARVQNGGVLTPFSADLGSLRAAIPSWRRHRICARSRIPLVRANAACALLLRRCIGRHGDLARSQRRVDLTPRGASTESCLARFASVSARFSAALDTAPQGGDGYTADMLSDSFKRLGFMAYHFGCACISTQRLPRLLPGCNLRG